VPFPLLTPANAVLGDLFLLAGRVSLNNQIGEIRCHMVVTGVGGASLSTQDIATGFAQTCDMTLPGQMPTQVTVDEPIAEKISLISGKVVESARGLSAFPVGLVAGGCVPTQVAAVVTKRSGVAGRAYRGRLYWPFLPDAFTDAQGELTAIAAANVEAATQALFNPFTITLGPNSVSFIPVIVHAVTDDNPLPLTYQPVILFSCSLRLGTQRRRGDYGALNKA